MKWLSAALASCLLLCVQSAPATVLENGQFDFPLQNGEPPAWSAMLQGTELSQDASSGDRSLIVTTTSPGGLVVLSQTITVTSLQGHAIEVALDYHLPELDQIIGGVIAIVRTDRGQSLRVTSGDYLIASEKWTTASIKTVVPNDATEMSVQLVAWFKPDDESTTEGVVFLDNARITELTRGSMSLEASAYLDHALDTIKRHGLAVPNTDFPILEENAKILAGGATTPADTYHAIQYVLAALGDGHSSLVPAHATNVQTEQQQLPELRTISPGIATLTIPRHRKSSPEQETEYVEAAHFALTGFLESDPCGLIVDLRYSGGGSDKARIAAVAPILGEGPVSHISIRNGESGSTIIRDGLLLNSDGEIAIPTNVDVRPKPDLPVAVLLSSNTASAGESVAIRFLGRPNTRSFGQATAGLVSANIAIPMPDGALLALATGYHRDRLGREVNQAIEPDVTTPLNQDSGQDQAQTAAIEWLTRSCRP